MQAAWSALVAWFPLGDVWLFVLGTAAVQSLTTLFGVALFTALERSPARARWGAAFDKEPPAALRRAARKQLVVEHALAVPLLLVVGWPLASLRGLDLHAPLPEPLTVLWQLALFVLVNDTMFYWAHRGLHRPWWFRKVHAQHHRFKHTRVEAFEFAHPLENAVNVAAAWTGPLLLGAHPAVLWLWLTIRFLETLDAHSGFAFPTSPWATRHAWHHRGIHGCYGSWIGLWDRVMGTDAGWRQEQATPRR